MQGITFALLQIHCQISRYSVMLRRHVIRTIPSSHLSVSMVGRSVGARVSLCLNGWRTELRLQCRCMHMWFCGLSAWIYTLWHRWSACLYEYMTWHAVFSNCVIHASAITALTVCLCVMHACMHAWFYICPGGNCKGTSSKMWIPASVVKWSMSVRPLICVSVYMTVRILTITVGHQWLCGPRVSHHSSHGRRGGSGFDIQVRVICT